MYILFILSKMVHFCHNVHILLTIQNQLI